MPKRLYAKRGKRFDRFAFSRVFWHHYWMAEASRKVYLWLILGLLATSFPAILVRLADAPALTIAFYRNLFAAAVIFPFIFVQKAGIRSYSGLMPKVVLTSFFLALHFFTWNASLKMTSVASSLVIVATQPIWSAIFGRIFLKEKVTARGWISIGIALSGIAAIAYTDLGRSQENLLGDLLALLAAIFASLYLILGRSVKDRIPLSSWLFAVYFGSCAFLFIGTASTSTPFAGFSEQTWLMFLLMALIPSAVGHSLLNYAVRHIEAYKVQLGLLMEPVVSSILAFMVFMESPSPSFYPGAVLALIGVVLGISERDKSKLAETER